MFDRVQFETSYPAVRAQPARADVACFVGFAALRDGALPDGIRVQWRDAGWGPEVPDDPAARPARPLPVVIDDAASFDALFDGWIETPEGLRWEGYLSGAVRDFFRQGGRRCVIVPVGRPMPPPTSPGDIEQALDAIVPGFAPGGAPTEAGDRTTWRGLGHLAGLPEVSLVCLPDLPSLVGAPPSEEEPPPDEPVVEPLFDECAEPPPTPPQLAAHRAPGPPRLGDAQWDRWQAAVARALSVLERMRPDVQLLVALPLFVEGTPGERDPLATLLGQHVPVGAPPSRLRDPAAGGIGSRRLQVSYPWLGGDTTVDRPGRLAPPDGALAGLLARNALLRGTFRQAAGERAEGVHRLEPRLGPEAVRRRRPVEALDLELSLEERVSLFEPTQGGVQLGSDVTPAADRRWRQGPVNRLVGVLHRSLRQLGEGLAFEPSGPRTWRRLRASVEDLMAQIRDLGGLSDRNGGYRVRCDATTMTQQDLDQGRMVAEVRFAPALAIEGITVVLTVTNTNQFGLASSEAGGAR